MKYGFAVCALLASATSAYALRPSSTYSTWQLTSAVTTLAQPIIPRMNNQGEWFFATEFATHDAGQGHAGGYIGILRSGTGVKTALFSIWGAVNAVAGTGCTAGPFEENGSPRLVSLCVQEWGYVRIPGVASDDVVLVGRVRLRDQAAVVCTKIGAIQVPAGYDWTLDDQNNHTVPSFTEWFGVDLG